MQRDITYPGERVGRAVGTPIRPATDPRAVPRHPRAPARATDGGFEPLLSLRFSAWVECFVKQPVSFWFVSFYLLMEYVRPQAIYRSLDILPWTEWAMIGCVAALVMENKLVRRWTSADTWIVVFSMIVLFSCFTAVNPGVSFANLKAYYIWVVVFVLITRAVDSETRFFVFYALFLLFSLKMSQHATRSFIGGGMRFSDWGATGAPGFFHNSGEMAIQMSIFLPMSAYFAVALKPYLRGLEKRWKYWAVLAVPATAILALIASSSRGGQLAGAAVILFMLWRGRQRWRGLLIAGLVGGAVWLVLPAEQKTRFTQMGEDDTSQSRLTYWADGIEIANDHPVLGIGYANWLSYYRRNYEGYGRWAQLPHNIFVEAGAELGYTGLLGFLILIGWTFRMNAKSRRVFRDAPNGRVFLLMALGMDAGLVGYMVSGFFVTVLYYPFFWVNFAMTAALYKLARHRQRTLKRASAPRRALRAPRQLSRAR